MPKFAANLTWMYNEVPFLDRFSLAAADGFHAIEFLFPYQFQIEEIKSRLNDFGLSQIMFNCPPGNWSSGERGLASIPGREEEFKESIEQALRYASALGNRYLHVMAGLIHPEQNVAHHRETYINNLAYAAQQASRYDITILIEPINTHDMPGYFLTYQNQAYLVCKEIGVNNLQIQFDIYHCQIMEGYIEEKLRRYIDHIGHMQIAGVPERSEPDRGELNYAYLFNLIDNLDYKNWIGCEYRPKGKTSEGLGWLKFKSD